MRSMEDKGCYNHGPTQEIPSSKATSFEFHKGNGASRGGHHRTALGKPTPSKWDDAQKWLVGLSRVGGGDRKESQPRNSNADDRRLIAPVPQMEHDYSSGEDEVGGEAANGCSISITNQYEVETKKVDCDESVWRVNKPAQNSTMSAVRSICVRDMGTEMTPIASQEPSRTTTPIRATTPAARSPVSSGSCTPVRGLNGLPGNEGYQTGLAMTESRGVSATRNYYGQESNGSRIHENMESDQVRKVSTLETRAMAWDDAERAKYMARYKREEVKIQAWENHEKRKAEMEKRKMEVKAERLKARAQERLANKLASTTRIAEEKRSNAEATLNEKAVKTSETADYIRRTGHLPSSFSFKFPSLCW
uniref:Remorin C-terminal domain-containing protein n=1 Tax=Populus trichocarpa TaxID=3694 RepID=A0A2K1YPH3_POPTR